LRYQICFGLKGGALYVKGYCEGNGTLGGNRIAGVYMSIKKDKKNTKNKTLVLKKVQLKVLGKTATGVKAGYGTYSAMGGW